MATQMAALDEFVTRARSQNDTHHTRRVQSLNTLESHAQSSLTRLRDETDGAKLAIYNLTAEHQAQRSRLEGLLVSLEEETRLPIQELSMGLSDASMTDYLPTGETPQKKDWTYPTSLPRTENHESIIARLRGLPDPALSSNTTPPPSAKTPARSPRKPMSGRKGPLSPSKPPSPSKTKVFTDVDSTAAGQPATSTSTLQTQTTTMTNMVPVDHQTTKPGLKEMDINVLNRPPTSLASAGPSNDDNHRHVLIDFSKSVGSSGAGGGQPPLKRHATANAVVESKLPMKHGRAKSTMPGMMLGMGLGMGAGVENFSKSVGPGDGGGRIVGGGRRLRSSPPE